MLTFVLHWPNGDVTAVVDLDPPTGPGEVDLAFDKPDEVPPPMIVPIPIVVPLAFTYPPKEVFLQFLEAKTEGAEGEVSFEASSLGMENLENLFPGKRPIEQDMPLPAVTSPGE